MTDRSTVPDPELRGLLDQLESLWAAADSGLPSVLAPGLSPAALDAFTSPLGIVLPPSAKTWYGWHNGTTVTDFMVSIGSFPGYFLSKEQAVDDYHFMLTWATESAKEGPCSPKEAGFDSRWFPIAKGNADTIVVDCDPDAPTFGAVWIADLSYEPTTPAADSIADLVRLWLRAHAEGYYFWDATQCRWARSRAFPGQPVWVEQRANGLV